MKIPARLLPLLEEGLIDEVLSRLMSGKEADVFVVRCGSEIRCAKVYKEAAKRSFKQAVLYQEGRKSRSSRRARAMEKGSKFGRAQQEETWHNAEVDALRKLAAAGVRVPTPYACVDAVLLMELVTDGEGDVAPRLSEVILTEEQALEDHAALIGYVVKMLCAGIVHGDLSEFNILVDDYGPVIIDLPQAVDAAANNNAESMLMRDVNKSQRGRVARRHEDGTRRAAARTIQRRGAQDRCRTRAALRHGLSPSVPRPRPGRARVGRSHQRVLRHPASGRRDLHGRAS